MARGDDDEQEFRHPSYGMISFSRVTGGGGRLFGSSLRRHYSRIRMTVTKGRLVHNLNSDRVFNDGLTPIIDVDMSSAQFAELITSLNFGSGVPCTINYMNGAEVEDPPDIQTEVERVKTGFGNDLERMIATMREYRARIEKATDKLGAKSKTEIRIALDVIIQQLTSNVPFVLDQFHGATDRVATAAKSEVEAFALHTLTTAGLNAIANQVGDAHLLGEPPPSARPLLAEPAPSEPSLNWLMIHKRDCADSACTGCKRCRCGASINAYGFEDHLCFNCRNPPSD